MDRRRIARIVFLLTVAAAIVAALMLSDLFSIEGLKSGHDRLLAFAEARTTVAIACFFVACVTASACCFPVAPAIGVLAGALFGLWTGLPLILSAFAAGSTISFLAARHLLRAPVEARLRRRLDVIDRGFARHGAVYLLALRFNPLVPYWLVNLAMGLTSMRVAIYVPLTLVGLCPALFIYVDAGTRLARLRGIGDIFSPGLIAALILLSLFPLIADRMGARLMRGDRHPAP